MTEGRGWEQRRSKDNIHTVHTALQKVEGSRILDSILWLRFSMLACHGKHRIFCLLGKCGLVQLLQMPTGFLCNSKEKEGTNVSSTLTPNNVDIIFLLSGTIGALKFVGI